MGFRVIKESVKEDKVKTNRLNRQLRKSCDKIAKTITEEVSKFREAALKEDLEDYFWMHAAHRAMLYISQKDQDSFLAAEIGDLFATETLDEDTKFNTHIDVDRLDKAKEKEYLKQLKKNK